MPTIWLGDIVIERVYECRYLGVILQSNPSICTSHCNWTLKRARKLFYAFRNYYSKHAPDFIWLTVYRSAIRSILDYCSDIVLPNVYYGTQFERLQKHVVRSYLHSFDIGYDLALWKCNIERLSNRRCASTVVNLMKYIYSAHFMLPNFCVFSFELPLRRGRRAAGGGVFHGLGTTCSPDPCVGGLARF